MVDEHAEATARARPEVEHRLGEMIEAVETFDDHTLGPKVVAPDLLDELGVVHALDEDAAGLGDAWLVIDCHRAGRGARWCVALRSAWGHERDDAAFDDEATRQEAHGTFAAATVAQHDHTALGAHHETDESRGAVLDDSSFSGLDDRVRLPAGRSHVDARPSRSGEAAQYPAVGLGHSDASVPMGVAAVADPEVVLQLAATGARRGSRQPTSCARNAA